MPISGNTIFPDNPSAELPIGSTGRPVPKFTTGPIGPDGKPIGSVIGSKGSSSLIESIGLSGGPVIKEQPIGGNVPPPIGAPVSPSDPSADPTNGTSGGFNPDDFDMDSVEGIDQAIAQLQSQIDTGRSGAVPDYSAFFQSPGYQFRQDEGIRAIDRSASARGQLMSGGTLRELQRYGQGLASSEFGNYANRLSALAGIGQTANQQGIYAGAAAGSQVGQSVANIGQSIMAGGTAQASGIIGANNAWQQGIGGVVGAIGGIF